MPTLRFQEVRQSIQHALDRVGRLSITHPCSRQALARSRHLDLGRQKRAISTLLPCDAILNTNPGLLIRRHFRAHRNIPQGRRMCNHLGTGSSRRVIPRCSPMDSRPCSGSRQNRHHNPITLSSSLPRYLPHIRKRSPPTMEGIPCRVLLRPACKHLYRTRQHLGRRRKRV
jgi:hypothetical protein